MAVNEQTGQTHVIQFNSGFVLLLDYGPFLSCILSCCFIRVMRMIASAYCSARLRNCPTTSTGSKTDNSGKHWPPSARVGLSSGRVHESTKAESAFESLLYITQKKSS